jgi:hypothetical protein
MIDLIIEILELIINPFDNQTEIWNNDYHDDTMIDTCTWGW